MSAVDRWPPIYDAEDLARCIEKVVGRSATGPFFDLRALATGPEICQGDIIELTSPIPIIDEHGQPTMLEADSHHWLVIGNTCDFHRTIAEAPFTQIVPLIDLGELETADPGLVAAFGRYQYARRFYVPPWPGAEGRLRYADFLTPVGVDKALFSEGGVRSVARMTREAWVLLHSCLVRFLCRDDGRFDEG